MKILIIFLIFLFSSAIYSEDLSEFEIEGISIGDSALEHVSEDLIISEIKRTSEHYKYLNFPDKFGEVYIRDLNFDSYSHISIFVKQDDENYKIFMIRGMISFDVLSDCLDLQKEIEMEFEDLFDNYEKSDYVYHPNLDPSGKSKKYDIYFNFPNGDNITLQCSDWSKEIKQENKWVSGISVALLTSEFNDWITDY
tara:strand:+ start:32 stop:619 length:588 start_codon:yes stop_codon:yes gene_type:complete